MKRFVMLIIVVLCGILSVSTVFAGGVSGGVLLSTAEGGDVKRFKDLIELDAGEAFGNENMSARLLQSAVKSGNTEMVQALLDRGVNINVRILSTSGKIYSEDEDLFVFAVPLVDKNFGLASNLNTSSVSKGVVVKGKKKNEATQKSIVGPDKGIKMIDFLIDKGFKPTGSGASTLKAAKSSKWGLVKYLHQKGASITMRYDYDKSLIQYLIEKMRYMNGSNINNRHKTNTMELIKYLIDTKEIDINDVSKKAGDNTALLAATINKDIELVKYLISKGAKNIKSGGNGERYTPLEVAINNGDIEMAKILRTAN